MSFLILFLSFLSNFLSVKVWDYDFWWHIATGRYIAEHRTLPHADPFSYANNLEENKNAHPLREKLILKQYWLAQVMFYKVYESFGEKGIIILRSLILLSVILLISLWLKRENASFYLIFPLAFLLHQNCIVFTGERPVLFSLLFTVITFIILEEYRGKGGKIIFFLLPVMTLWANLHGGFILGIIIIVSYAIGETFDILIRKNEKDKKHLLMLILACSLSIVFSSINPNGLNAFLLFSPQNRVFEANVQEYFSPFVLYRDNLRAIDWEYIALIILAIAVIILRNRKLNTTFIILITGLLYASATSLRYQIFFVLVSTMIIGKEMQLFIDSHIKGDENSYIIRYQYLAAAFVFISSLLYAAGFLNTQKITFEKARLVSVPQGASEFIKSNHIEGNLFSDMGSGGYLIWSLYPWKKVFIDTRSLNYILLQEYEWMMTSRISLSENHLPEGKKPLWERLIDHYNIDLVVLNSQDPFGTTPKLIFSLMKSDKWTPVYIDQISIVFVRNSKYNQNLINEYRRSEDVVYNMLIARLTQWAMHNKGPRYLVSLGDVFFHMGRYEEAVKAYAYADKRLPGQKYVKLKMEKTQEQIENKNKRMNIKEKI